jgi:hypothetical protein
MAEVHVNIKNDNSGSQVVFHQPSVTPPVPNQGIPVAITKDASGKVAAVNGQVPNGPVLNNPA